MMNMRRLIDKPIAWAFASILVVGGPGPASTQGFAQKKDSGTVQMLKSTSQKEVLRLAASLLGCDSSKVAVTEVAVNAGKGYDAVGCGKKVQYVMPKTAGAVSCHCIKHCPVGPGSPGGGTTCCEWKCDPQPTPAKPDKPKPGKPKPDPNPDPKKP